MTFLSLPFAALVLGTLLLWNITPYRFRYLVILAAGLIFCGQAGREALGGIGLELLVCFAAGLTEERLSAAGKSNAARRLLFAASALHVFFLVLFHGRWPGLSFLTLIFIAYEADVCRGKTAAEKNPLRLGAFVLYFPQISQGPVSRYDRLAPQIFAGGRTAPDAKKDGPSAKEGAGRDVWEDTVAGLMRILWGLLKKLVLADRLAVYVGQVYENSQSYAAEAVWLAVFLYAIQIYADFSGCMDMVLGISRLFGIHPEENFRRPYLARSFEEYWKRWHITMGAWFREYVFYPLAVNGRMLTWSQKLASHFKKDAVCRAVTVAGPLLITWLCTGFWHGFGVHYVLWGLANGLLILWETCRPARNRGQGAGHVWPVFRTFFVLTLVRVLFRADSTGAAFSVYGRLWHFGEGAGILAAGLDGADLAVVLVSIVILTAVDLWEEYGRPRFDRQGFELSPALRGVLRFALCFAGAAALLIFGVYGPGYHPAEFFYSRF